MPDQTVAVKISPWAGSPVQYVAGTVNGAAAEFQWYQGDIWRCTAPRSETGAYEIALEAYDQAGNRTEYATTLQYGFAAVTNRGPGAYYNAEDLNRVGHAVEYLGDLLEGYGYSAGVRPRTDWTMGDLPTEGDMAVYLGNIRALMEVYCVLPSTPPPPETMARLGYRGANAIEQILVDMYMLIQHMAAAWCHCGEVFAGEV